MRGDDERPVRKSLGSLSCKQYLRQNASSFTSTNGAYLALFPVCALVGTLPVTDNAGEGERVGRCPVWGRAGKFVAGQ